MAEIILEITLHCALNYSCVLNHNFILHLLKYCLINKSSIINNLSTSKRNLKKQLNYLPEILLKN
jgi:hypothetical protein